MNNVIRFGLILTLVGLLPNTRAFSQDQNF